MVCTPGGEAPSLPPFPLIWVLAARFSVFSASCLFPFLVLLAVPLTFFPIFSLSDQGKEGGEETPRNYSTTLGASSAVARSLLSQFANRTPGPRIVHLHFTIFRSEINTTSSAPHRNSCVCVHDLSFSFARKMRASSSRTKPAHRPRKPSTSLQNIEECGNWSKRDRPSSDRSIKRDWRQLIIKTA